MTDELTLLRDRYLTAQLAGNRREAIRLVIDEGVNRGHSVGELQLRVVQDAQREIGRLWQEDRISIAQEHMATAISHVVLAQLYQQAPSARPNGKRVLVACVEGELHDFPSRLVSDALELAGFDVRFLGANVPTDSLLTMLETERPDLLALSVTMTFHLPALREVVRRVRERCPGLPIAVGGHACTWSREIARDLRADLTACDAYELVDGARRVLGMAPS
jgi:MerR family transcriptional regulator, light-induced transcriptional regulator